MEKTIYQLVTDDNQITQEVVLCELHRKSEKVCPKCGRPLFHENYANTAEHYPYLK